MKINGITAAELTALAEIMLEHAVAIPYEGGDAMDNCGTGGDHSNSFNVSTTAAFVLAAGESRWQNTAIAVSLVVQAVPMS